jgi:hypothetical protein
VYDPEAIATIARQLDEDFAAWDKSLTHSERAELRNYQALGYLRVNPVLRDEIDPSVYDEQTRGRLELTIDALDTAISRGALRFCLTVYRGLRQPLDVFDVDHLGDLVGETFTDPAYVSTSLDLDVAAGMTASAPSTALLALLLQADQPAAWLSLAGDRRRRHELELLLPRGTSVSVEAVESDTSRSMIRAKVIG